MDLGDYAIFLNIISRFIRVNYQRLKSTFMVHFSQQEVKQAYPLQASKDLLSKSDLKPFAINEGTKHQSYLLNPQLFSSNSSLHIFRLHLKGGYLLQLSNDLSSYFSLLYFHFHQVSLQNKHSFLHFPQSPPFQE